MDFALLRDAFWSLTFDGIALGAIYALISLGYTLVYGVLRLINFAHSEVFMIGTFASLLTTTTVMGFSVEDDPLTGSKLSITLVEIFRLLTGSLPREFPRVLDKTFLFSFWGADVRNDKLLVIIAAALMMVLLDTFINKTRFGKGIRAVSMDEGTAALMGVNINRVITVTFLMGGLMAGAAGYFFVLTYENTSFKVGFVLGLSAFTAAVLGGIGNVRGALVGSFVLGLLENYSGALFGVSWKSVITFTILVLVLLFRPTGILGESIQQARV